jgi:membrane associated rhomboid family serine protease
VIFAGIVAGNWLGLVSSPPLTIACGASSGVCGAVGGYVAARLVNRGVAPLTARDFAWVGQILAINLAIQAFGGGAGLDHYGHLGGLLGGAVAAVLLGPRLKWATRGGGGGGLVDAPPLPVLLWRGGRVPPGW